MTPSPDFDTFAERYALGKPQVVWTSLVADLETPVSAMLKLAEGRRYSFLLESVTGGEIRGRYSLIGMKPDLVWRCFGDRVEINRDARHDLNRFEPLPGKPLDELRALIAESRIDLDDDLPPMAAGLFGFMTYDMVRQMERIPDANPDAIGIPDAIFIRPTVMAIFDTIRDRVIVVTPVWPCDDRSPAHAYDLARERLADVVADFGRGLPRQVETHRDDGALPEPSSNMTREQFHGMVERAKDYIRAGDIFQVVPSQRFTLPFELPPFALYRALRRLNPSPFLFHLDFGDFALVGSSPEILVRLRDDTVTIRPLAGTRPRGGSRIEDEALATDLMADPKERAEHLMLLDLGRNDVGRVAKIGTVKVTEKEVVEYYSHVMHISSTVEGKIRDDQDAMDALAAGFPAGTVSGAPKIRAMEIIDELEPERRSFYAGTVGYLSADGDMDTCIALRTSLVKDGKMYVQAGVGVVADSDPEAEYQESRNKAMALIRAAEEAVRFASSG
ncbi:MAG: anthranilate synthase component I [Alphaproteobacteria bacterium]|nr:anthranilate synthase component I [Alphaproteobacteria bacterium]